MMPAAILHLLGTAQPEGTGIARIVAGLAAGLDPARYRVHAWFLGPPGPLVGELQAAGATARSLEWWRGARDPVGALNFWQCMRKSDFAIVHQHFGSRAVRRLIHFSSDARLVVHFHGNDANPGHARRADRVIAASQAVAREIPELKPVIVYAGVEDHPRRPGLRPAHLDHVVVGAASRLVPQKGLLNLIRTVAALCPEFPRLRLEIAGSGPQLAELETEVAKQGLADRVRFTGWQQDLRAMFQDWDIFAMPSLEEGFGMAALEAMAEGLPVVATSIGGLPEIIEEGKTGYLVTPSDVTALADRLRLLLADKARRVEMGTAGRERARVYFSRDRMVAGISEIYDGEL